MPGTLGRICDRLATGCLLRLFSGAVAVGFIWLTWYLLVKADLGCCTTVLILAAVFLALALGPFGLMEIIQAVRRRKR
jgi:hypothetical protein